MMISKADIAAFCRDVVYGKVKGKKMMLKKKGLAVRRILALILVLFLVGTTTPAGQERVVYGAAATPVSRHGRLSVKGADLVDASRNKFQLRGISTHGISWDQTEPAMRWQKILSKDIRTLCTPCIFMPMNGVTINICQISWFMPEKESSGDGHRVWYVGSQRRRWNQHFIYRKMADQTE